MRVELPSAPAKRLDVVVVVTYLNLDDLRTKQAGWYQRLRMILESAQRSAEMVEVICLGYGREATDRVEAGQRIQEELAQLWNVECRVRCMPPRADYAGPWLWHQLLGASAYHRNSWVYMLGGDAVVQAIESLGERDRIVVVAHRLPAAWLLTRHLPRSVPLVYDLDDLEHRLARMGAARMPLGRDRLFRFLSSYPMRREERRAAARACATLVCSEEDARFVAARYRPSRPVVIPNSVRFPETTTPVEESQILLMVGDFENQRNAEGARHFLAHIWPRIREAVPHVQAWFAGRLGETLLDAPPITDSHIRILGFVENLEPVYAQSQVVICPLLAGSGTRVKIIEAAAHGRPVVSTSIGQQGLGLSPGVHILTADEPDAFADACVALLRDPAWCQRMAISAAEFAGAQFSRPNTVVALASLLSRAPELHQECEPAG